ncbi:H-NS family nucleoid-associated regulatory protein [Paraburkholderia panacisoli]
MGDSRFRKRVPQSAYGTTVINGTWCVFFKSNIFGKKATSAPAPATEPKTKAATKVAGNYARGPQPAKYRNPKSGATWSGRGRAPEWLASAKDRTRFLIEGDGAAASEPTSANKASKPKSAAKNGAVAKKGAAKGAVTTKLTATKERAATGRGTVSKSDVSKAARSRAQAVNS